MNDPPVAPVVQGQQIDKDFREGELRVSVLKGLDFCLERGEQVAIIGASGSGKSTLLHVLGGLSRPSRGRVLIDDQDLSALSVREQGVLRNARLGFVYQFHHLLPEFTALENVAMPLLIRREDPILAGDRAGSLLEQVGLADRMAHKPAELSGGERQRAAIARAMVTRPACIMADEPTGNLDAKTAAAVYELLLQLNQEQGTGLIIATHDMGLAARTGRILALEEGRLEHVD